MPRSPNHSRSKSGQQGGGMMQHAPPGLQASQMGLPPGLHQHMPHGSYVNQMGMIVTPQVWPCDALLLSHASLTAVEVLVWSGMAHPRPPIAGFGSVTAVMHHVQGAFYPPTQGMQSYYPPPGPGMYMQGGQYGAGPPPGLGHPGMVAYSQPMQQQQHPQQHPSHQRQEVSAPREIKHVHNCATPCIRRIMHKAKAAGLNVNRCSEPAAGPCRLRGRELAAVDLRMTALT